ncbi:MAG: glucan biosynthesis protein G [Pseudomonadota bacterium]
MAQSEKFSRKIVLEAANALALKPYEPPQPVPEPLLNLDYDQYRKIQYQKDAAIWGGSPTKFSIELFAPGNLYTSGVDISVIENGEVVDVPVENDTFTSATPEILELLAEVDKVAGFRLHYTLNNPDYKDEFVVFQGASYFRAVSRGQNYGMSARGLAIDVAEPTGEEFPIFRQFWIERPSSRSDSIVVHALLDSPRATGAYRFGIYPDDPTHLDVEVTLFAREELRHIGLAPLTSMFMFGDMDRSDIPDYRTAVHDSQGLAMLTGQGEYLWRPLSNPTNLQISGFGDTNPQGFGLVQRNRDLGDYEDLQANYHKRPSTWVTPIGDWGTGQVVLVEIPTRSEANDNIVAYWRPLNPLMPGTPYSFAYQLNWPNDTPLPADTARITRTAFGLKIATPYPQIAVDYSGLPEGFVMEDLSFDASLSAGTLVETQAEPIDATSVRLFITIDVEGETLSEVRVQPKYKGAVIGETLLYRWTDG